MKGNNLVDNEVRFASVTDWGLAQCSVSLGVRKFLLLKDTKLQGGIDQISTPHSNLIFYFQACLAFVHSSYK